jgi:glycosyltransferase involved in cell wall biosynthesis
VRIAYLCKRQYMGHDVILDRYARLYEQPLQLARRGHDVLGLCLSYRPTDERDELHDAAPGQLRWIGLSPGGLRLGLVGYPSRALTILRAFKPDIVVGASDAPHIIIASWLSRRLGVPFAADLYDHFESFGLSRLPGIVPLYRRALRDAAVVTCVSAPLAELVQNEYRAKGQVLALPSTIDRQVFYPRDRLASRQLLGLPSDARLIGTAGGLSREKGIEPLYRAFEQLAEEDPNLHLALAGPLDPACPLPLGPRVHYLGKLPHARTADFFSALDVGVVYVRDTPYGRYSFPQKAYEMAACGVPVTVAGVGAMASLFASTPQAVYAPDDVASLVDCIRAQLESPQQPGLAIPDWAELAGEMEAAYTAALKKQTV